MKKNILVTLVLLAQITFGQKLIETRTATLVDGDYSLDGTVYLELFDDDSLDLRFDSDYKTSTNVFDVHVYLSTDNNFQKPIDTSEMLLVENIGTMTGLNYSSGARTFDLPAGVGINDYKYVVFVCVFYNRLHWQYCTEHRKNSAQLSWQHSFHYSSSLLEFTILVNSG